MITLLAGACIFKYNKILLVQTRPDHREPLKWAMPGGHGNPGETPTEIAVREVKEETNLDIKITGLSVCALATASNGTEFLISLFTAIPLNPDQIKFQESEVHAMSWATKDDIMGNKYPLREEKILKPLILRSFTSPPAPIDSFIKVEFKNEH